MYNLLKKNYFYPTLLMVFMAVGLYIQVIQPENVYTGMQPLTLDYGTGIIFVIWLLLFFILTPKTITQPSDIYLTIYGYTTFIFGSGLWQISGQLDVAGALLLMLFLAFPMAYIRFFPRIIRRHINIPYLTRIRPHTFLIIIVSLCSISLLIFLRTGISNYASFDIQSVYDRRMGGRGIFSRDILVAYVSGMMINGFAPFLAFLAFFYKKYSFYLLSIVICIIAFWTLGLKSPVLLTILCAILGSIIRKNKIYGFRRHIIMIMIFLSGFALIENSLLNYSYLADYFFRRSVAVAVQIQGYYIAYMLGHFDMTQWLMGLSSSDTLPTFLIGDYYFDNIETNANTNTFLYSLLKNGILGYCFSIIVISILFNILNTLNKQRNSKEAFGLAFLFSFILTEQVYTTALLSSGIFLLFCLLIIFRISKYRKSHDNNY